MGGSHSAYRVVCASVLRFSSSNIIAKSSRAPSLSNHSLYYSLDCTSELFLIPTHTNRFFFPLLLSLHLFSSCQVPSPEPRWIQTADQKTPWSELFLEHRQAGDIQRWKAGEMPEPVCMQLQVLALNFLRHPHNSTRKYFSTMTTHRGPGLRYTEAAAFTPSTLDRCPEHKHLHKKDATAFSRAFPRIHSMTEERTSINSKVHSTIRLMLCTIRSLTLKDHPHLYQRRYHHLRHLKNHTMSLEKSKNGSSSSQ